jgi:hypothetical protein
MNCRGIGTASTTSGLPPSWCCWCRPGTLAGLSGWLAFRSKVSGVYVAIITQALTYALMLAFSRNEMGFGGSNGLTDFKDILGFSITENSTSVGVFVASGIALIHGYFIGIGFVPQGREIFSLLPVEGNLKLAQAGRRTKVPKTSHRYMICSRCCRKCAIAVGRSLRRPAATASH